MKGGIYWRLYIYEKSSNNIQLLCSNSVFICNGVRIYKWKHTESNHRNDISIYEYTMCNSAAYATGYGA